MLRSLVALIAVSQLAQAHMELAWPYPIKSRFNSKNLNPDYNLKAPLAPDGAEYPCKNYNTQTWPSVTTLEAGNVYNATVVGSAFHNGGSCQLALSYDGGDTFGVIKSFIGGCPGGIGPKQLSYTVPSYAPSGDAILAWTWVNKVGNREFYMNCASVTVAGRSADQQTFKALPDLWLANLKRINTCTTIEGRNPVFPQPGPEVEYGDGMSSTSPKSPSCGRAANVQNAELPSSSGAVPASSAAAAVSSAISSSVSATVASSAASASDIVVGTLSAVAYGSSAASATGTVSYFYSSASCDSSATQTITVTEEVISTISGSMSSARFSTIWVSESYSCSTSTGILSASLSSVTAAATSAVQTGASNVPISGSQQGSAVQPGASSSAVAQSGTAVTPPQPSSSSCLPYVEPASFNQYLPCVVGAFLCSDASTFYTCVQGDNGNAWMYPRVVAPGMMCLPSVDPNSPGQQQQPGAPAGYYRDDLYTREGSTQPGCPPSQPSAASASAVTAAPALASPAAPGNTGSVTPGASCSPDGTIGCFNNGQSFAICNNGQYVNMGAVAPGTVCVNGQIVANSAYSFQPASATQAPAPASSVPATPPPEPTENDAPGARCASDGALGCYNNGRSFVLCDHGSWVNMGSVAAGTQCRNGAIVAGNPDTGSAPGNGGGSGAGPSGGAAPGRACGPDGSLGCFNNGQSFLICDHGYWVNMGSVAPGTACVDGGIVAA